MIEPPSYQTDFTHDMAEPCRSYQQSWRFTLWN